MLNLALLWPHVVCWCFHIYVTVFFSTTHYFCVHWKHKSQEGLRPNCDNAVITIHATDKVQSEILWGCPLCCGWDTYLTSTSACCLASVILKISKFFSGSWEEIQDKLIMLFTNFLLMSQQYVTEQSIVQNCTSLSSLCRHSGHVIPSLMQFSWRHFVWFFNVRIFTLVFETHTI